MTFAHQILYLVSALGAFNGFVLSLYLFLNKKRRSITAFFLSMLLLAISLRITNSVFSYFNPDRPPAYQQIGWSACFLIGPSLYFFLKASLTNVSQIPASWKKHWGILGGVLLLVNALAPFIKADVFCQP